MFIITFLSLGLEQVVLRRVSASKSSEWAAAAYLLHTIVSSVVAIAILYLFSLTITTWNNAHILMWFFVAQALTFIGSPLKQFLNAKERFAPYGVIALISNTLKLVLAWFLLTRQLLHLNGIIWILVACSFFEFVALLIYILAKTSFSFRFKIQAYVKLVKEARGQFISVIFDSGLSRMDWILLGLLSTNAITGDYSFAYRAFELARLPIIVVAPLLMPKFARLFSNADKLEVEQRDMLNNVIVIAIFLTIAIPVCLNIVWSPWIGALFDDKYGASNAREFGILSICIPLHFLVNLFWTISFSAKRYRYVSTITIVCAVCNLLLNVFLIGLYGGLGAAFAFITTTIIQVTLYYRFVNKKLVPISLRPVVILFIYGIIAYLGAVYLLDNLLLQILVAMAIYISLSLFTGQLTRTHLSTLRSLFTK